MYLLNAYFSVYKLRFKSAEEGSKSEEILITPEEGVEPCSCLLEVLFFGGE